LPVWDGKNAVEKTVLWYRSFYETGVLRSIEDLESYIEGAKKSGMAWVEA
jgi:hypothetical protein